MTKLEKRLSLAAIVFVLIYLGAVGITLHDRITGPEKEMRIESAAPVPGERHLMMAELLLPMLILLAIGVSFIVAKKKREKAIASLEDAPDDWDGRV
jgi:NADH:ubiquinone oxidoreductase subunit 6 (subunit J)